MMSQNASTRRGGATGALTQVDNLQRGAHAAALLIAPDALTPGAAGVFAARVRRCNWSVR